MKNTTQAVHLDKAELGLMCNLLYSAMHATGKEFGDQQPEVKMLSTKLARAYERIEKRTTPKVREVKDFGVFKVTTITDAVKRIANETPQPSTPDQP